MNSAEQQDAHMQSPPYSAETPSHATATQSDSTHHPTTTTASGSAATAGTTTHPTQPSQPSEFTRPSSRKTVPDGYIYEPYESKRRPGKNLAAEDNQTSAIRILELRELERRIIQMLETAGQAVQVLTGNPDEEEDEETGTQLLKATRLSDEDRKKMQEDYTAERLQRFQALSGAYYTLVNDIQIGLRRQFRYLTKAGIASSQVPFKNVVYGEEKELETWLNAVDVLEDGTRHLIDRIEHDLVEPLEQQQQHELTG